MSQAVAKFGDRISPGQGNSFFRLVFQARMEEKVREFTEKGNEIYPKA
jgi:hypothetical protein